MSRRGAGSAHSAPESKNELVEVREFARRIVKLAKELLREGLDAGEVSSLFTDAAATLSKQRNGFSRQEWLDLCEELYDRGEVEADIVDRGIRLTAPGGVA